MNCFQETQGISYYSKYQSWYISCAPIRYPGNDNPTPLNWGRTYSRMRLSSTLRARTIRPWTAQDTQYCCLMYSLGRVYSTKWKPIPITHARKQRRHEYLSGKTHRRCFSPGNAWRPYPIHLTSKRTPCTLGTQRKQWVHLTGLTWPLPFLERPWFLHIRYSLCFLLSTIQAKLSAIPTFSWKAFWLPSVIW